jgi:hypothetical protein
MKTYFLNRILIIAILLGNNFIVLSQEEFGTTAMGINSHETGLISEQKLFASNSSISIDSQTDNFTLISHTKKANSNSKISVLGTSAYSNAPVNIVDYQFINVPLGTLNDIDLQYDSKNYVVGVANFKYIGEAFNCDETASNRESDNFVARTFISSGSWHLEIQNKARKLSGEKLMDYEVTLIIYNKSSFRNKATINTDLEGLSNGKTAYVPSLY